MDIFQTNLDLTGWVIFCVVGILTGIINTLAGSGSLITLPIFMFFCGLDALVANGTNRVGVLLQSWVGIATFRRTGNLPLQHVGWLLWPSIVGAVVGALLADWLGKEGMEVAIGLLMVVMLGVLLIKPQRWLSSGEVGFPTHRKGLMGLLFFGIGIYGGFIQAGVGIFLLAGLVLAAHFPLGKANAIKLLLVGSFNILALGIFLYKGQVHIGLGLAMALFQSIGAILGVRFVAKVPHAEQWIYRLLVGIVVVSAGKYLGLWDLIGSAF